MKYLLKNKDQDVLSFEYEKEIFENNDIDVFKNIEIINKNLLPLNFTNIEQWIKSRKVPKNRKFFDKILSSLPSQGLMNYIDFSLGLSLNDSYWVCKNEEKLKWSDVNLYQNNFSDIVSYLAFNVINSSNLNFDKRITSPEFTTNGMLKKCWKKDEDGKIYLLKGQTEMWANGGKEAYSEFYMSQIASLFEKYGFFKSLKYELEKFNNEVVSKCEIFTNENIGYAPIYYFLNNETSQLKQIYALYGKDQFEDLMIFDAIIGNIDRHLGNYGFLIDNNSNKIISNAPVFDNGLSILNIATLNELYDENFLFNNTNALDMTFHDVFKKYLKEKHFDLLQELKSFKFKTHDFEYFNLEEKWIIGLENFIHRNAEFALSVLIELNIDKNVEIKNQNFKVFKP